MNYGRFSTIQALGRRYLAALALLAVLVGAFIPAGFMPDLSGRADRGVFALEICSGFGTATVYVDQNGRPLPAPDGRKHSHACAYAPVLAQGLPLALPVLAPPVRETPGVRVSAFSIPSFSPASYDPRGPPLSFPV